MTGETGISRSFATFEKSSKNLGLIRSRKPLDLFICRPQRAMYLNGIGRLDRHDVLHRLSAKLRVNEIQIDQPDRHRMLANFELGR